MSEQIQTEVSGGTTPPPSVPTGTDDAPVVADVSSPQPDEVAPVEAENGQAEAAFVLPETDDDLKGQENNPHVRAVLQMRQEIRTRNQTIDGFKPLEAWKPVAEKFTDVQEVQKGMEYYQGLNAPVLEDGQIKRNQFGAPETTPLPFLKMVSESSPDTIDKMANILFRTAGLDPSRIDDYKRIDLYKQASEQSTVAITPEELAQVPEEFHEAYKGMLRSERDAYQYESDLLEKQRILDKAQFGLNNAKAVEAQATREQQARETQAREQARVFEQKVEEGRGASWQQGYNTLVTNLAKTTPLSSDPVMNEGLMASAFSVLTNALDPATAFIAENVCKAAGAQLHPEIPQLAQDLQAHTKARIHFEQTGDTARANEAKRLEGEVLKNMLGKATPAILAVARMYSVQGQSAREATEEALAGAQTRAGVNGNGAGQGTQSGVLPAGMKVGSFEAAKYLRDNNFSA